MLFSFLTILLGKVLAGPVWKKWLFLSECSCRQVGNPCFSLYSGYFWVEHFDCSHWVVNSSFQKKKVNQDCLTIVSNHYVVVSLMASPNLCLS